MYMSLESTGSGGTAHTCSGRYTLLPDLVLGKHSCPGTAHTCSGRHCQYFCELFFHVPGLVLGSTGCVSLTTKGPGEIAHTCSAWGRHCQYFCELFHLVLYWGAQLAVSHKRFKWDCPHLQCLGEGTVSTSVSFLALVLGVQCTKYLYRAVSSW